MEAKKISNLIEGYILLAKLNQLKPKDEVLWVDIIKEYAKAKCKEQRQICMVAMDKGWGVGDDGTPYFYDTIAEEAIENAPEPKFE